MPSTLFIRFQIPNGPAVTFTPPYYDELLAGSANARGCLPREIEAHALWYYYQLACQGIRNEKLNIAYEHELSKTWGVKKARQLIERVAFMYQRTVPEIVRHWDVVDRQRVALGFGEGAALPHQFRFRFN